MSYALIKNKNDLQYCVMLTFLHNANATFLRKTRFRLVFSIYEQAV